MQASTAGFQRLIDADQQGAARSIPRHGKISATLDPQPVCDLVEAIETGSSHLEAIDRPAGYQQLLVAN